MRDLSLKSLIVKTCSRFPLRKILDFIYIYIQNRALKNHETTLEGSSQSDCTYSLLNLRFQIQSANLIPRSLENNPSVALPVSLSPPPLLVDHTDVLHSLIQLFCLLIQGGIVQEPAGHSCKGNRQVNNKSSPIPTLLIHYPNLILSSNRQLAAAASPSSLPSVQQILKIFSNPPPQIILLSQPRIQQIFLWEHTSQACQSSKQNS